eukprot:TRINITY_DN9177_c0_g2_i1.p1 TRINITY_DN9177_c0_g2~~TRINITY_DN9177_c0_g2_i1.p1  ORF type:complete len:536 (+),score=107.98 TRINITY_DN9177_c0_g2_i1:43-1608(+)
MTRKFVGRTPQEVWSAADESDTEQGGSENECQQGGVHDETLSEGRLSCEMLRVPGGSPIGRQADLQAALHSFNACEERLEDLWAETGADAGHRSKVLSRLWKELSALLDATVEGEERVADDLRGKLMGLEVKCRQLEAALHCKPLETTPSKGDLTSRIHAAQAHLSYLQQEHAERIKIFKILQLLNDDLNGKPSNLPIPTDLSLVADVSLDQIDRCIDTINAVSRDREAVLNNMLILENQKLDSLWDKLMVSTRERNDFSRFLNSLTDGHPSTNNVIKAVTLDSLKGLTSMDLAKLKQGELAGMLCGCTDLQEALGLTQQQVKKAEEQYQRQLAVQVVETKELLLDLYKQYDNVRKVSRPSAPKIPDDPTERNLALIEGDVLVMEKKLETVKTALSALSRRDELLKEKVAMEEAAKDKDRLTDRSRNMAQILLQEERTRKALKKELPKLEKTLKTFCESYRKENNGCPFVYNDSPLEDQLSTVPDSPTKPARARAHSPSTTRKPRTAHSPAPVNARRSSAQ